MSATTFHEAIAEQSFLSGAMMRLRRRKLLIVSLTVFLFVLLALGIEMLPKSYRAIASVAIEGQTPTAVQAGDVMRDSPFDEQTLGTELAILQSRELLTDTINRTGLLNKPEFNPNIRPSWQGQILANLRQSFAAWLPAEEEIEVSVSDKAMADTLDTLIKHMKLTPTPRSRVINIAVSASNNLLASQIANTIADLYIGNHRTYKQAASRAAHDFLANKIDELQQDASIKAGALEQYRITHGLTTAMTATLVQEQLSGLSTQLQTATVRLATLEGLTAAAKKSNPQQLAEVLQSPTIQKYREQEGVLTTKQAQMIAAYGAGSPMLGQINAQVAQIRSAIAAEASKHVQSLTSQVAAEYANVTTLNKQLADLRAQAQNTDEARAKLATLTDDATTARTVYNDFLARLRSIDASMAYGATDVRVISHAVPPTHPAFPDLLIMLPAALILSVGTAGMVGYATTRPKGIVGTTDLEALYNINALGMLPLRTRATETLFETAIEQLLNRLYYLQGDQPPKSILITSALPQEGKTTTANALAEAAGRRGLKVMLVDADMHSARAMRPKTTATQIGLGDVLRGQATVDDVAVGANSGIRKLPAGSPRGNSTSLMALPSLKTVMRQIRDTHDLIIVDAPPSLVGGDCEMLSRAVDTTVMLVKWHSTSAETVAVALRQLDQERLAGMVLTMVDTATVGKFGHSDAVGFSKPLYKYYEHR